MHRRYAWDSKSTNLTLLLNSDSPNLGYRVSHRSYSYRSKRRTAYEGYKRSKEYKYKMSLVMDKVGEMNLRDVID